MHSCIFILYIYFAVQYISSWYIFSNEWDSNDVVFYICDVECLLKRFAQEFVLFHCVCGNKEKLDFSIIC